MICAISCVFDPLWNVVGCFKPGVGHTCAGTPLISCLNWLGSVDGVHASGYGTTWFADVPARCHRSGSLHIAAARLIVVATAEDGLNTFFCEDLETLVAFQRAHVTRPLFHILECRDY